MTDMGQTLGQWVANFAFPERRPLNTRDNWNLSRGVEWSFQLLAPRDQAEVIRENLNRWFHMPLLWNSVVSKRGESMLWQTDRGSLEIFGASDVSRILPARSEGLAHDQTVSEMILNPPFSIFHPQIIQFRRLLHIHEDSNHC
jgi:hypothetical protein